MPAEPSAVQFVERLRSHQTARGPDEPAAYFSADRVGPDEHLGVRMGQVFELAKAFIDMPPVEIERLLKSRYHDVRAGAVSIMDWQARRKSTPAERRKELFDLYIHNHEWINDWDLVDRSAPYVVGGYLADKPRDILYTLARSNSQWERRTAIVATYYFIRQGDLEDTFKIAEILVHDPEDLVQKAVGGWIREAGKKNLPKLIAFLDQYAASMPRTMLRYAVEHLDQEKRARYMGMKKNQAL